MKIVTCFGVGILAGVVGLAVLESAGAREGRVLTWAEAADRFGGSASDMCCVTAARCVSAGVACNDPSRNTEWACNTDSTVYREVAGNNTRDCELPVNGGVCITAPGTNPCRAKFVCGWNSDEGKCFETFVGYTANAPTGCGDNCT